MSAGAAVTDNLDRAIKRESEIQDQQTKMLELLNIPADIDEDALKALNLAHLKHPWLEQNIMFMAMRGKLFTHFNRLEL